MPTHVHETRQINGKALSADVTLATTDIADGTNKRYVTDAQRTVIQNTSGTNTGNQDLSAYATSSAVASAYVPKTLTVAGKALSGNITLSCSDLSDGSTVVLTGGSYANPAWITGLAWGKLTGLPTTIAGYGIADAYTKTQVDALVAAVTSRRRQYLAQSVALGVANTDAATFPGLPGKYAVVNLWAFDASGAISIATAGLNTAAAGGGTAVVVAATLTLPTSTTILPMTVATPVTVLTAGTLYFRVGTAHLAAASVSVLLEIIDLS